jgi:hypothetical protein
VSTGWGRSRCRTSGGSPRTGAEDAQGCRAAAKGTAALVGHREEGPAIATVGGRRRARGGKPITLLVSTGPSWSVPPVIGSSRTPRTPRSRRGPDPRLRERTPTRRWAGGRPEPGAGR